DRGGTRTAVATSGTEPHRRADDRRAGGAAGALRPDRGGCDGESSRDLAALRQATGCRRPAMSRTHIPQALRTEAEIHFRGRCAYCLSPQALMNVTFEVDHILPEKEGGLTVSDNLAFSCPLCNGFKGARTRG